MDYSMYRKINFQQKPSSLAGNNADKNSRANCFGALAFIQRFSDHLMWFGKKKIASLLFPLQCSLQTPFTTPNQGISELISPSEVKYAGLRLHYPINTSRTINWWVCCFQGAITSERCRRGQSYGLSARGSCGECATPKGERVSDVQTILGFWTSFLLVKTPLLLHAIIRQ